MLKQVQHDGNGVFEPSMNLYPLIRPLAFRFDAERAHRATLAALSLLPSRLPPDFPPSLHSRVAGIDFTSPVGLAAGFDKNAEVPEEMLSLGFGFVEVGTVTPRPQPGNPKPRLFRLVRDRAIINRLGFNNDGQPRAFDRLLRCHHVHGVIGVNVGANKDSADRVADYAEGVRKAAPHADYITINVSSPNTPGLRDLQSRPALDELLAACDAARDATPLFLKIAPDLDRAGIEGAIRAAIDNRVDALIVSNTTISRPEGLRSRFAGEAGGLSGAPLCDLARAKLTEAREASGGELPLISAGGIDSADEAKRRLDAGAVLVQVYSALVYKGPGLIRDILSGIR
jgi:dihydroorotate dehydrogenase